MGSLARPLGGWLADRTGGARLTAAVFTLMAAVTLGAIRAADGRDLGAFLGAMLALFALAGVGNGSTYKMIPAIFRRRAADGDPASLVRTLRAGSATLGMAGAVGALGGFAMPRVIGDSIKATHGITQAFTMFTAVYVVCLLVTWRCYLRRSSRLYGV